MQRLIKEAGGIILAMMPIPMVCIKEEVLQKASPGRDSDTNHTP